MDNFIYEYYVRPIVEHTGYNMVNTLTYAAIAIAAVYSLLKAIKGRIGIDGRFIGAVLCFVLFGSTIRVVTDAIDSHVFAPVTPIHAFVLDSHLWDYSFITVTPGVYILTAGILLIGLAILYFAGMAKRIELLGYAGLLLWLPHFILLIPFMVYAPYAIPILLLAALPAALAYLYFKDMILAAIVAGQALDGAATFFVIDVFSKISGINYFEQHVVSSGIGELTGTYFTFYLVKVALAFAAAYVLQREKMDTEDRNYVALVLMIMGFAPGIRDILRMVIGG